MIAALPRCALGIILTCVVSVPAASAFDLTLPPGATLVRSDAPRAGSHDVATGVWDGTNMPIETLSGSVSRTIWTLPAGEENTVASLAAGIALRLQDSGAELLLSCAGNVCGGFDFRRRLDLGQSPEMLVDIGNYHYIAARDTERTVAITVSRGGDTLYVHTVSVGMQNDPSPWVASPISAAEREAIAPDDQPDIADRILRLPQTGAVALDDLFFRTGASDLSGADYPSLMALAEFLSNNRDRRIALVGHTDTVGNLDSNIALSRARAEAVRQYLIEALDVDPTQVSATGIGYLAPRATNETEAGREANRRVEAVLLHAE
jgi:outer membrane protein OmpA-like peptidoglycan-associated protein